MLAYELFLKNKDWNEEFVNPTNVKKVYVKATAPASSITINFDDKTLQEYGDNKDSKELLKNLLQMPRNTLKAVGLPFRGTGANSPRAYVEFYGVLKKNTLAISVSGRHGTGKIVWKFTFDFEKESENYSVDSDLIKLRLDKENYFVQNNALFDCYIQDGIINKNCELQKRIFLEVCRKFVSLCKTKNLKDKLADYKGNERFRLVILPYSAMITPFVEYHETTENDPTNNFIDAFGMTSSAYPSKSTQTAKFLSYDDPAFSINCTRNQEFYMNLGIGCASFEKINMPPEGAIEISGLSWYFFDINDPTSTLEKKASGFYDNLLSGFNSLQKNYASTQTIAMLKILCVKKSQAKLEVLIDENLTFTQLKKILSRGDFIYCPMVFESLIKKKNQEVIWSDYVNAIRFYIKGLFFERNMLVKRIVQEIRENLFDWLHEPKLRDSSLFSKSSFLLKILTKEGEKMDLNEEYAYKIGKIAGKYVNLKKAAGEAGSSINEILTYTKYDRERLRHAYKRVCLGAALIKDMEKADELNQFIKANTPPTEIDDTKAGEDYSYWFYKGVFETL
ncbi:MAG: hypothetical protein WHU54_02775 [Candidatus Bathyarchaeia archaeon]